ncbi:antitoxin [Francisella noatunensis]|uniref:Antitoxin n=1 Tax=Francisella noatunensis TaxID=657445 RepID=A0A9Q2KVK1_9GAMM|nr:type II toxin-antitoxin system VapB family antitoxin [Francisella noatunensis]MBK2029262.1 antitoxin [Francisella noatunensis]MBK2034339.1 antitoxin [Francisella noatunensis]MBK2049251.1 antitoxin [Francisella noatunensis]MBK2050170.1 antitoxin [Francisella noatunensis]MBK2051550.1 antitoxin [Francisella noatunensis]
MLTKLFKSGNSQAVRIPKEMQFKVKEVDISRVGNSIIITEIHDNWDNVFKSLDQAHDFFDNGRDQPQIDEREAL